MLNGYRDGITGYVNTSTTFLYHLTSRGLERFLQACRKCRRPATIEVHHILRPLAAAFHLPVRCSARTGEGEGRSCPGSKAGPGWGSCSAIYSILIPQQLEAIFVFIPPSPLTARPFKGSNLWETHPVRHNMGPKAGRLMRPL